MRPCKRRTLRLLCLGLLALATFGAAGQPGKAPECKTCHWERRLDADLGRFEQSGIKLADLDHALKQPCGGYLVSISNGQLYAYPQGWEALPDTWASRLKEPHIFLQMFTKILCLYPDVPDVTFVMNTYDRLCIEDKTRAAPVVSWGKDTMADDPQILMPYWTFLRLNGDVASLGVGPSWSWREEVAIWRGTTTGGHFSALNWMHYPRSLLVKACNNSKVCDAKYTGYPQASKEAEEAIKASGGHGNKLSMSDFLNYKYIIVNDGNMAPSSRLSIFLQSGSLLLKQETPSIEFYYDDLQPYMHYVPLSYNFGDIEHKVRWAQRHDDQARAMAERAHAYAKKYLTDDNVFCYMYRLVKRYSLAQRFKPGFYNSSWQHVPNRCPAPPVQRRG